MLRSCPFRWLCCLAAGLPLLLPPSISRRTFAAALDQPQREDVAGLTAPALAGSQDNQLNQLLRQKAWKQAAELAEGLAHQYPGNPAYPFGLGVAKLSLTDPIGAIQAMRRAESLGLNSAQLHINLGLAYYLINQYRLFRDQMTKAINLDARKFEPHYYLGRYLELVLDDVAGALKSFEQAGDLSPNDPRIWYHKGYCYKALGRQAEAQGAFEKAIELGQKDDEHFSLPFQGMAQVLAETDPERALQFARQAVEREPNLESNHLVMAKVYERMGKLAESAAELQTAIKLDPSDASPRFLSFRIYTRLGNEQAAKAALDDFKKVSQLYGSE